MSRHLLNVGDWQLSVIHSLLEKELADGVYHKESIKDLLAKVSKAWGTGTGRGQ